MNTQTLKNALRSKKNKKNKKGFTLIELIIVIAIIGVLALLATPRYLRYINDAHVAAMKADAKVLSEQAVVAITNAEAKGAEGNDVYTKAAIFDGNPAAIDAKDKTAVEAAGIGVSASEQTVKFKADELKKIGVKLKNKAEDYRYMIESGEVYTTKPQKGAEGTYFITNKQKDGLEGQNAQKGLEGLKAPSAKQD